MPEHFSLPQGVHVIHGTKKGPWQQSLAGQVAVIRRPLLQPFLVDGVSFRQQDHTVCRRVINERARIDLVYLGTLFGQNLHGVLDALGHLRIGLEIDGVEASDDPDLEAVDAFVQDRP